MQIDAGFSTVQRSHEDPIPEPVGMAQPTSSQSEGSTQQLPVGKQVQPPATDNGPARIQSGEVQSTAGNTPPAAKPASLGVVGTVDTNQVGEGVTAHDAALGPAGPSRATAAKEIQPLDPKYKPEGYNNPAAVAIKDKHLDIYRKRFKALQQEGRAKPDMIAFKELKHQILKDPTRIGHVPGCKIGLQVDGKGELAILGLHTSIVAGIDYRTNKTGAMAIVLSGGYKDDDDQGESFWYTGMGGQKKRDQSSDQKLTKGNLALQQSYQQQLPVRVCRAKKDPASGMARPYVYEGLYYVREMKQEASQDGPLVYRFHMVAIPGESVVSTQVQWRVPSRIPKRIELAGHDSAQAKRCRTSVAGRGQPRGTVLQPARKAPKYCVLVPDISRGLEAKRIPLVVDADCPVQDVQPPQFQYIHDYVFTSDEARAMAAQSRADAVATLGETRCGLEWMGRPDGVYNEDGQLMGTEPMGIMECSCLCKGSGKKKMACRRNNVVSDGSKLPLQVFMTTNRGWGVRCTKDISPGTFIITYIGELMTSNGAEERKKQDEYLFDMDHLTGIWENDILNLESKSPPEEREAWKKALPFMQLHVERYGQAEFSNHHLVVDAKLKGNVARFINHACPAKANLLKQVVFARDAYGPLGQYLALFAYKEIPAYTELTYDYGYKTGSIEDVHLKCQCGAADCNGRLL